MSSLQNVKDSDPFILLSIINMKLRDFYHSLELLCDDLNIDEKELIEKLKSIGYGYNAENNQFTSLK